MLLSNFEHLALKRFQYEFMILTLFYNSKYKTCTKTKQTKKKKSHTVDQCHLLIYHCDTTRSE